MAGSKEQPVWKDGREKVARDGGWLRSGRRQSAAGSSGRLGWKDVHKDSGRAVGNGGRPAVEDCLCGRKAGSGGQPAVEGDQSENAAGADGAEEDDQEIATVLPKNLRRTNVCYHH